MRERLEVQLGVGQEGSRALAPLALLSRTGGVLACRLMPPLAPPGIHSPRVAEGNLKTWGAGVA